GLLHRLGEDVDGVEVPVGAVVRERPVLPGPEDDLQGFLEPGATLGDVDLEGVELVALIAAPDAPVDAAVRQDVEGGQFFGGADRRQEGQHGDRRAQPDAAGAGGDVGHGEVDGRVDPIATEVVLGEPRPVVAEALGLYGFGDLVAEDPCRTPVLGPLYQRENPDVHPTTSSFMRGTACTSEQYVNAVAHQSSWRS